jgi:signal transduction histidine kinase
MVSTSLRRTLATVIFALLCGRVNAYAQDAAKTVLAIFDGPQNHPANLVLDRAIRDALIEPPEARIDYFAEFLDRQHLDLDAASAGLRANIAAKYANRHIDVVLALTDTSLDFVRRNREALFPDAPIAFAGLALPPEIANDPNRSVTGVLVGIAYAETLKAALALHPSVNRVVVVAKTGDDRARQALVENELDRVADDMPISYINAPTVAELLQAVKAVPAGSLIVYLWHQPDEVSNFIYPDTIAEEVAGAATVPVYGTSDFYIGLGVVGGVVRKTAETGRRIGEMARRLLRGEPARNIPIETARLVPIFDWRQLRRWGVDESKLPPGSDVRFRTPTPWEAYRGYILGTIVVLVAQLLLISLLLMQVRSRRRAEKTIRARESDLWGSLERIRQMAGRLINAQEEARAGVARDLHDEICQQLAAVAVGVVSLKRSSGDIRDPAIQQAFADLEYQTQVTFDGIRRLSHDLHPTSLQLLGLSPALKTHCLDVAERQHVRLAFSASGDFRDLPLDVAICLYRIAQEAVRNAVAHGRAQEISVAIARLATAVELAVTDDGQGFDVEAMRRGSEGLGLVSMEERARNVGGFVDVISAPDRGTTVRVRCPSEPARMEVAGAI